MLEIAVVSALVMLLVEAGKNAVPRLFSSTYNALLTVMLAIVANIANAAIFGGDIRSASQAGVILGLSLVGAYRTVSSLSKKSSVDMTEQAVDLVVDHPAAIREAMNGEDGTQGDVVVQGFGK